MWFSLRRPPCRPPGWQRRRPLRCPGASSGRPALPGKPTALGPSQTCTEQIPRLCIFKDLATPGMHLPDCDGGGE